MTRPSLLVSLPLLTPMKRLPLLTTCLLLCALCALAAALLPGPPTPRGNPAFSITSYRTWREAEAVRHRICRRYDPCQTDYDPESDRYYLFYPRVRQGHR